MNTLSNEEKTAGFKLLFNGTDLSGWRGFKNQSTATKWRIEDNAISLDSNGSSVDLITSDEFADCELLIDWKISQNGNSGIFYLVQEDTDHAYDSGPEYQVLDNAGSSEGSDPLHSVGSMYDLVPVSNNTAAKPAGEWNTTRIIISHGKIQHWLNGVKLLEQGYRDASWTAAVARSKWAVNPAFGKNTKGHIGLQDHGNRVWFRNIKIRTL